MSGRVVIEGAIIKCSCGAIPTPLRLSLGRDLQILDKTVGIITDRLPLVNIQPFGVCSKTSFPCIPVTPAPWTNDIHVELGGVSQPLLTETSTLQCAVGGVIQILEPGQKIVMIGSRGITFAPLSLMPQSNSGRGLSLVPTGAVVPPLLGKLQKEDEKLVDAMKKENENLEKLIKNLENSGWFGSLRHKDKIEAYKVQIKINEEFINNINKFAVPRDRAKRYAELYAEDSKNSHNLRFPYFEDNNCANFASQVLYAGGVFTDADVNEIIKAGKFGVYEYNTAEGLMNTLKSTQKANEVKVTAANELTATNELTAIEKLEPGDLIFHKWPEKDRISHVDVYLGNGKIASNTNDRLNLEWNSGERSKSEKWFLKVKYPGEQQENQNSDK